MTETSLDSAETTQNESGCVFVEPDSLLDIARGLKAHGREYWQAYWRWVRFGPDEAQDAASFEAQWQAATQCDGTAAVTKYYEDERLARQTSLMHLKSDVNTLLTLVSAMFAVFVGVAALSPNTATDVLGSAVRWQAAVLLALVLVLAASAHAHRFLYTFYTHFMGVAHHGKNVVDDKSYTNNVRKQVNGLSRTLQRGRRRYNLARLVLAVLVCVLAVHFW